MEVTLNGESLHSVVQDHYLVLDRPWRDGDELQIRMPMAASYESLPDAGHVVNLCVQDRDYQQPVQLFSTGRHLF